ncbi:unnamed protein product [Rotaria magnacalcarata]
MRLISFYISLIFDILGPEVIRAVNDFYYLAYEGAVNLDSITNPTDRAAIETQIRNFGQESLQLLTEPHPPRNSAMNLTPIMYNVTPDDVSIIMKFSSNTPIIHASANASPTLSSISNINVNRRRLGDNFDEGIQQRHQSFVVTVYTRFIISTSYWDKSFRVSNTDIAKITQVLWTSELRVGFSGSEHSLALQHTLNGDILCSFENSSIMRTPRLLSPLFMNMVLNADSQYTVIDDDRGFVQIIRAHDLQPVYAYPQCDASICSL